MKVIQTTTSPWEGLETQSFKGNGKTILASYNTLNNATKNGKVSKTAVGNIRSNIAEYGLDTLD